MRRVILLAAAAALGALPAANAQTIGPDAFGYRIQKATTGTFTSIVGQTGDTLVTNALGGTSQDDVTFTITPGFNIPFYGTNNSQVFVSTNGFVAFGGNTGSATGGSYTNPDLSLATIVTGATGAPTTERAVIGVYWDDLFFTNSATIPGGLHTLTRTVGGVNELVLEWNGVQYFGATANTLTFQAILRSDGSMQFNYPDTSGPTGQSDAQSASIGVRDLNGGGATNRYVQWGFNTAGSVTSGTTLNVLAPVPEPGTLVLCSLAVAGGYLKLRRRKAIVA